MSLPEWLTDFSGRKRRIHDLEAECDRLRTNLINESNQHRTEEASLQNKLRAAQNQIEYLVRTIRDMDQEIWHMGQKTDWIQQRPHFVKLHDEMTARKVEESKRIGSIIRGEIIDTYAGDAQKRIGK
jgi:hypothetical protein